MEVTTGEASKTPQALKTPEIGPHLIRITDSGKIRAWVSFALSFLEENENRPIVFHTLPSPFPPVVKAPQLAEQGDRSSNSNTANATTTTTTTITAQQQPEEPPHPTASNSNHPTRPTKVTHLVPRLLSVVEIVKREFIKSLEAKRSPRLAGLHQYNEIGCLEATEGFATAAPENDRATEIVQALSGRNHVQQKQTPYMKVTLSLSTLPEMVEKGATYQPPTIRKLTKSAKMRIKKRERLAKRAKSPVQTGETSIIVDPVSEPSLI